MGNLPKNNRIYAAVFLVILIAISGRILYNYKQPADNQVHDNKWLPPAAPAYVSQNYHNPIKITEVTHNNLFKMTVEPDLAFNMPCLKFHFNSEKYQTGVVKKVHMGNRTVPIYQPPNIGEHILRINLLGKDGSSIAPEAKLVIKPFDIEFNWLWGMDFNDKVSTIRVTLSKKDNPANKAQWIASNLPASIRLAGDSPNMQRMQVIKSIVMEANGAEIKASPYASALLSNTGVTSTDGLIMLTCNVRVTTPAFHPRESWYLIASRHSAEWSSMVKNLQYQSVTTDLYSNPEYITPLKSNNSEVIPIHAGISFSGMQQYIKIDGALVERNEYKEIVTLHDADIVYEPLHHCYVVKWKEDQTFTTSTGIQIKPLNIRPQMKATVNNFGQPAGFGGLGGPGGPMGPPPVGFGGPPSDDNGKSNRTTMLFIAWYLPKGYNSVRNHYQPPTTSYVTEPTPNTASLDANMHGFGPMGPPAGFGGPANSQQYNWENVCLPNDNVADVNDKHHITPGIHSLNDTYSLLYYPIALPKGLIPKTPFHLKEFKLAVFISNVKSVNPFSFTVPVKSLNSPLGRSVSLISNSGSSIN